MKSYKAEYRNWKVQVEYSNSLKINAVQSFELLRFAITGTAARPDIEIPPPMNLHVQLHNSLAWTGVSFDMERRIKIGVGDLFEQPRKFRNREHRNMPSYYHLDWVERLLGLFAHEIWHIVSDAEWGRPQEYEAECHEVTTLQMWRIANRVEVPAQFAKVSFGKP